MTHPRPRILFAVVIVSIATYSPTAQAQLIGGPNVSRGPGASLLLGANFCTEHRTAVCTGLDVGFGMDVELLWRVLPYLSAHFDLYFADYDARDGGEDVEFNRFGFLFEARAWLPIHSFDIFTGLGLGWSREALEQSYMGDQLEGRSSGFTLGLSFGVAYRIIDLVSIGILIRYLMPHYKTVCIDFNGDHDCAAIEDPLTNHLMFGLTVTSYFTRASRWSRRSRQQERRTCEPSTYSRCPCQDGSEGVRRCFENGSGWGSCQCGWENNARACDPGATQECLCNPGVHGVQLCEDSGTRWGACRCEPTPAPNDGWQGAPNDGWQGAPNDGRQGETPNDGWGETPVEGWQGDPTEGLQEERDPGEGHEIQSRQAAIQAFLEGQESARIGDHHGAVAHFQRSFEFAPQETTLARLIEEAASSGDTELVVHASAQYLERYPEGPHRAEVEARLSHSEQIATIAPGPQPSDALPAEQTFMEPVLDTSTHTQDQERGRAPPPRPRMTAGRHAAWATLTAGLFLSASGGGLYGSAVNQNRDFINGQESASPDIPQLRDHRDQGQAMEAAGWALFGLSAASIVSSILLFTLLPGRTRHSLAFLDVSGMSLSSVTVTDDASVGPTFAGD